MLDSWLLKPARLRKPEDLKREFRVLHVPRNVSTTLLDRWRTPPAKIEPILRLVKKIVLSNAVHRARMKQARWAAGQARDPHHKQTAEKPGALSPILETIEGIISDLERLIDWKFIPPIEWQELNAKHKPTGRTVRLSSLNENIRGAFKTARSALLVVREHLREDTRRSRGRKATLVHPFRDSAVRRREFVRMLRDQILPLHPAEGKRSRAARVEVDHLAREIIDSILPLS